LKIPWELSSIQFCEPPLLSPPVMRAFLGGLWEIQALVHSALHIAWVHSDFRSMCVLRDHASGAQRLGCRRLFLMNVALPRQFGVPGPGCRCVSSRHRHCDTYTWQNVLAPSLVRTLSKLAGGVSARNRYTASFGDRCPHNLMRTMTVQRSPLKTWNVPEMNMGLGRANGRTP
jgi:hypothetical protein